MASYATACLPWTKWTSNGCCETAPRRQSLRMSSAVPLRPSGKATRSTHPALSNRCGPCTPSADRSRSRDRDNLPALARRQGAVNRQFDRVADEVHRPVREGEIQTGRMPAVEGVDIGPIGRCVHRAIQILRIGTNSTSADGVVGVGPGTVRVPLWHIFSSQKGIAQTVINVGELLLVPKVRAREDAVAVVEAILGTINGTRIDPTRIAADLRPAFVVLIRR